MKKFSMKRQTMKTNCFKKYLGGVLTLLFCAAMEIHAQQRTGGGGGGGFGGFGGFGGGGGFNANRNNASSSSSGQYNNNGTVGSAVISVDPVTHNIMVIADKQTSEQIRQVIASLDAPEPQVLIKVVFLEVQDNTASDIGVQGTYTGNHNYSQLLGYVTNFAIAPATTTSTTTGSGATATTTTTVGTPTIVPSKLTPVYPLGVNNNFGLPQALAGAAGNGGLYQLMGSDFNATLQAIATAGKAQVLSRPSILARDGQMAEIVVGQSLYLPSGVSFTAVGGTSTTIPTINGSYQNVGIQLDVTPFIGANNLVQMILQPQITSVDSSTPGQQIVGSSLFSGAVYAPNINKRSANTVVVTPDGQPVVIGGLISNDKSVNDSKIPFLGDIPLLGQLFKFSAKSNQKTELLIFLTPHIVQMPSQLAALSANETGQSQLITNSISEQELDRFLERVPVKKNR
jgi:general secretion pathway protein D